MRKAALLTAVLGAVLYWAPGAQAFECGTSLDTFGRANGSDLGPNWTEQAPELAILDGELIATGVGNGLATYNGIGSPGVCVDVATSAASATYAAIVLRYANLSNNVFVKVEGFGNFSRVHFLKGNNGTPWDPSQPSHPVTAFSAARLHVAADGTNVTADIDTNFDNQPEQTVTEQNLPLAGLGGGIGLGGFQLARLDNFAIPTAKVPDAPQFSCRGRTATHVGSDARDVIRGTKGRDVIVGLGARDILRVGQGRT